MKIFQQESNITIDVPPILTITDYVSVPGIGEVSASFDFSGVDPRNHEFMLGAVINKCQEHRIQVHPNQYMGVVDRLASKLIWRGIGRFFGLC